MPVTDVYSIALWADIESLSDKQIGWLFERIIQTSPATLRHSITPPDEVVVKWVEGKDNPLDELGVANAVYSYAEIADALDNNHWTNQEIQ